MTLKEKLEMLNQIFEAKNISKRTFDMAIVGFFLIEKDKQRDMV